jgi:hypothetical protein
MGRDTYPIKSLLALWDYSSEWIYLDFARKTALRLLSTQCADGGFSGQAGAGVMSGVAGLQVEKSISFGSGILAPIALFEWAMRDKRHPADLKGKIRKWADLMIELQSEEGYWPNPSNGTKYTLIGAGALFSLVAAGKLLEDKRCLDAVGRFLDYTDANNDFVDGTHSFLQAQYAHCADAITTAY